MAVFTEGGLVSLLLSVPKESIWSSQVLAAFVLSGKKVALVADFTTPFFRVPGVSSNTRELMLAVLASECSSVSHRGSANLIFYRYTFTVYLKVAAREVYTP
jgi:hypothetical protein